MPGQTTTRAVVRWPRYSRLAVLLERAAREQRSTFYFLPSSVCTSVHLRHYSSSSCPFYSRKTYTWLQLWYQKPKFQAPGTTFSNFSDEVRPAWNHIFQVQRRGPPRRRRKESAVALAHSPECTKDLMSALPNVGSFGTFGARAENETSSGKKGGRRGSGVFVVWSFFFCGCVCFVCCATQVHKRC